MNEIPRMLNLAVERAVAAEFSDLVEVSRVKKRCRASSGKDGEEQGYGVACRSPEGLVYSYTYNCMPNIYSNLEEGGYQD